MGDARPTTLPLRGDWLFPTEIRFGAGRIEELGALCLRFGMKRPLIVTDRGLAATPLAERVLRAAEEPGVTPRGFVELQENPTGQNIEDGVAAFRTWNADGVIALGGGSGLDGGKTIALLAGCGGALWRFAWPDHVTAQSQHSSVPIIAVPTTAGYHHGLTNGVLMSFVLAYNRPAIEPAMMELAAALHIQGDAFESVHRWVLDLRRKIDIPESVTTMGLARAEFDRIAGLAAADICAGMNPVPVDAVSLRSILDAAA